MQRLVAESFKGWAAPEAPIPALPNPPLPDQAGVAGRIFLIDRPGASQVRCWWRPLPACCLTLCVLEASALIAGYLHRRLDEGHASHRCQPLPPPSSPAPSAPPAERRCRRAAWRWASRASR